MGRVRFFCDTGIHETRFCKAKMGSSQQPQRRVSLCGLWSREHTQFFAKRPQRSKNAGAHRTPDKKSYGHTRAGRVRFFIAIQKFMKPVFAEKEEKYH